MKNNPLATSHVYPSLCHSEALREGWKHKVRSGEQSRMVSVILITKNEQKYIKNCLESIFAQEYKNIEIILVDKYSNDNTIKIAKEFDNIKIYFAPKERCTQVNFGVKKAQGKYIYISGVDKIFHPKYLRKAVEKCENEGCDAIYTSVLTKNNTFFGRVKALERECYLGDNFHETARFVKKKIFEKMGGYDENLVGGEDYDFQRRLNENNYKTGRVDVITEYHFREEENIPHIIKRSFYYGKTLTAFFDKYKTNSIQQFSPVRMAYFRHWKLWVKNPDLLLGFVVYKTVQYSAGGAGFIYQTCKNLLKTNEK